jgi:hypothetical protein
VADTPKNKIVNLSSVTGINIWMLFDFAVFKALSTLAEEVALHRESPPGIDLSDKIDARGGSRLQHFMEALDGVWIEIIISRKVY